MLYTGKLRWYLNTLSLQLISNYTKQASSRNINARNIRCNRFCIRKFDVHAAGTQSAQGGSLVPDCPDIAGVFLILMLKFVNNLWKISPGISAALRVVLDFLLGLTPPQRD